MMKRIIFIAVLICGFSAVTLPQDRNKDYPLMPKEVIENRDCGLKFNRLNGLLQYTDDNIPFIIVSHLGKGEKVKLGERRLFNIKTYFTLDNFKYKKPSEFIITAQGEQSEGRGYLDVYIRGELELRIFFQRNEDLYLGDCAPEKDDKKCVTSYDETFYPCKNK